MVMVVEVEEEEQEVKVVAQVVELEVLEDMR